MADSPGSSATRRTAVYSYLRPLIEGRRVLEIGCGAGDGAAHLASLGARGVVAAGSAASLGEARRKHEKYGVTFIDVAAVSALKEAGPYDAILFPDAAGLVAGTDRLSLGVARELLRPGGFVGCVVANGDLPGVQGGLGYYDLLDALTPHFPRVRMFGQTPFAAFGIAEFDSASGGLRVESGLVDESAEQPTHYVAVAGPEDELALGYALVQVPPEALGLGAGTPARSLSAETPGGDLRRKLAEVEGQLEGVVRVSRAQTEEIEELRARLRRAADSRAELDEEVTRLRRALTDADESVINITRRTTEEMTALAQRVTSGLRGGPGREETPQTAALLERLRDREAALAARESALSDRDERIAALEVERQDLIWRLQTAEEERRRAETRRPASTGPGAGQAYRDEELLASQRSREQAIEDYRRAAAVHLDETARLREALNEQSAAVLELEEALSAAQTRLQAAEQEAVTLRKLAGETEEADRGRRSRLAELEGTLLRLQRQAAAQSERKAAEAAPVDDGQSAALRERVRALELETKELRAQVTAAEEARDAAEDHWDEAAERIVALERMAAERDELAHSEESLRARVSELEARADGGRLHSALAEVDRLRSALERSEEQLWDARGKLLADRERLEALERAGGATPATGEAPSPGLLTAMLDELGSLEAGLRTEAAQLAAVERVLAEWRAALADNALVREDVAPPANES